MEAFGATDFRDDLPEVTVPAPVLHGVPRPLSDRSPDDRGLGTPRSVHPAPMTIFDTITSRIDRAEALDRPASPATPSRRC